MLTLSAGSSCDVCFERFGRDLKAPCSIICGHVFCFDCVSHVNRLCPLCRTHFEPSSCIKLHLDVDTSPQSEQAPGSPSDDEREAQRLHQAINKVADTGIEEQALKQLIQEGRDFLSRQPRHMYKDLRNSLRMMAYMCELKHTLLGQKQMNAEVTDEVQRLSNEKSELLKKLVEADEQRKYERETALAVETSLREHYALATRNYQVLIQVYNKLAQTTHEMLKTVPMTSSTPISAPKSRLPSTSISDLLPPLDMKALDGVAARDPDSNFLISPLPQFTNTLPSVLDGFMPLPDLTEDAEGEERSDEDEDEEVATPDSLRNHRSIQNNPEIKTLSHMPSIESLSPRRADSAKGLESSGLSRTAPYLEHSRRARSSSNPSVPTSRSQSPFDRSGTTSPRMTPPHQVGTSSPPRYPAPLSNKHTEPDVLRTRLHDLLKDSPTSTSMPNLPSSHFPPTLMNREREHSALAAAMSPPTRTGPTSSKPSGPQPSADGFSHLLASGQQSNSPNKPVPTPSPNPLVGQKFSSASAQAKQLEEERRRRYLEEKQSREERSKEERYREERYNDDRYREDRPKEDYYREGRYREPRIRDDRHAQEYDRSPVDADRDYRSKTAGSAPSIPTSRREHVPPVNANHIYGNPMSSNGGAALKRGSSIGGGNSRSRPIAISPSTPNIPEPPQIRYTPAPPSSGKSRPIPMTSNTAGIYAS